MIRLNILIITFIGLLSCSKISAAEVDHGLFLLDRESWKTSWVQESKKIWSLTAIFDNGIAKTYFEGPPPSKGFGLTPNKKPIRQEFRYFPVNKTFISKKHQFEQWPDGAIALSFEYSQNFKLLDQKYEIGVISIIQEVNGGQDEIRYSITRTFK